MLSKYLLSLGAALCSLFTAVSPVLAQGTAFTYNGRLNNNGTPVTGAYDLRFTLFDANANGNVVAGPLPIIPAGVTNGLFTVALDFGTGVFTGPARWLNIEVRPTGGGLFTALAPRQEVTSSPYAIRAQTAGTVATGAVTADQLNTAGLAPAPGQFLSYNGGSLFWSDPGVAAGSIWSQLNNNAYYTAGNVGIGTTTPSGRLQVAGDWDGEQGALQLSGHRPTLRFTGDADTGNQSWLMHLGGVGPGSLYFFRKTGPAAWSPVLALNPNNDVILNPESGNVGIGSPNPVGKLEVVGQDALRLIGFNPFLTLFDSNAGYARSRIQGVGGDVDLFTESYLNGANPFSFLKLADNGNVGIGSVTPVGKLEVVAQDALRLVGYQPFLTLLDSSSGYARSRIQGVSGEIVLEPESFVNSSDGNAYAKLFVSGNFSVKTLTIRGGADLAEPFEFSVSDIAKGSVLVIDDEQPGKLKLSDRAYDTRVAGIVSGANGVNPGISLHQEGVLESGQNVALSGRVYVLADAAHGAIRPGDLLTTSDTPGHAMRVGNHAQSQGAILGKAMSALKEGKGMVLVLVTLQ
jgi:hypothetical protein